VLGLSRWYGGAHAPGIRAFSHAHLACMLGIGLQQPVEGCDANAKRPASRMELPGRLPNPAQ